LTMRDLLGRASSAISSGIFPTCAAMSIFALGGLDQRPDVDGSVDPDSAGGFHDVFWGVSEVVVDGEVAGAGVDGCVVVVEWSDEDACVAVVDGGAVSVRFGEVAGRRLHPGRLSPCGRVGDTQTQPDQRWVHVDREVRVGDVDDDEA
jgi:hypothetical protein